LTFFTANECCGDEVYFNVVLVFMDFVWHWFVRKALPMWANVWWWTISKQRFWK